MVSHVTHLTALPVGAEKGLYMAAFIRFRVRLEVGVLSQRLGRRRVEYSLVSATRLGTCQIHHLYTGAW